MSEREFPAILHRIGFPVIAATWLMAGILVWDQTVLTWEEGPKVMRFAMFESGWHILLFFIVLAGQVWPLAMIVAALVTRRTGGRRTLVQLVAYALAVWVMTMPYGLWQRLFIEKYSPERVVDVVVFMAGEGDLATVKAFIERGVDVNARSRQGYTALQEAVSQDELPMIEYLIEQGADVNALDPFGESPLVKTSAPQVLALLVRHGAVAIRPTKDERRRIRDAMNRKHMAEMGLPASQPKCKDG